MEALEVKEKIEEVAEGHEGSRSTNLRIGLLIAALAALLALLEAGGKAAQTEAINANLQASDLWAFFQSKTARVTTIRTAAETAKLSLQGDLPAETKAAIQKQIDAWNATAERYDSEPQTGEGRKELTERAKEAETERDRKLAATTSLNLVRRHLSSQSCLHQRRSSLESRSWSILQVASE
jgi:hypothetical protein